MSEAALIIEGPSQEDVVKSLTTFMSNKKLLYFTLEGGQKFKALAYGVRDMDRVDEKTQGHVYVITLTFYSASGPGRGAAEAICFIGDELKWGRWTVIPET